MALTDLMIAPGPDIYYDDSFRRVLEDHMAYLRGHAQTAVVNVDAGVAYKYEADFYGLLAYYRVPAHLHWVVLRLNRLSDPAEFNIGLDLLLVPDAAVVDRIRQSHMTTRRVS